MKATVPALVCLATLLLCSWKVNQAKKPMLREVEITVYGPDGRIIPPIHKR